MTDEKAWPPAEEDPEGPEPEEIDEQAPGIDEGFDGDSDTDSAGTSDPRPYG